MRTTPRVFVAVAALVLALPVAAPAQETGAADASAADVRGDDGLQDARDRLHLLLLRPDVRRTARDRGIDLAPIHDGIETLDAADLARVAPYADDVEAAATQSAITISTTTIIIALLLLILVVLIA